MYLLPLIILKMCLEIGLSPTVDTCIYQVQHKIKSNHDIFVDLHDQTVTCECSQENNGRSNCDMEEVIGCGDGHWRILESAYDLRLQCWCIFQLDNDQKQTVKTLLEWLWW